MNLLARIQSILQFEKNGQLPGICSARQFQDILRNERYRADRNGHQFSLLVFDVGRSNENYIQMQRLADVLRKRTRWTDNVGLLDNKRIGVVLPYTTTAGAWRLADDVCQVVAHEATFPKCSVCTYPAKTHSKNGEHPNQLHFADLSPEWKAAARRNLPTSAQNVGRRNNDFALEQSAADTIRNYQGCSQSLEVLFPQPLPLWKRSMDVAGALFGLIVLSPLLLIQCFIIKIVSPGPVLFKQERIKCLGKMFRMLKFRTMDINTDVSVHKQHLAALIKSTNNDNQELQKPMVKLDNDPQIIPLGKYLRKMCLDEIPQLINVLRGEMSLVGPRPPLEYEVEEYPQWCYGRFNTVPGMTGLWQVSGKNRLTFDEMVRLDIRYSREKSFWLDIKIILKTPSAIIAQIKDSLQKKFQKGIA